jgi:hypothetical protein
MPKSELSASQIKAIAALLSPECHTNEQAAKAAGVAKRTLQTWLTDDTFRSALRDAQDAAIERGAMRLAALVEMACFQLADNLTLYSQPQHALRAAKIVLDHVGKYRDLVELEQRIVALEARDNASEHS